MPLLTDHSSAEDWVEPDDVSRRIVAYGVESEAFGDFELEPHSHVKGQVILVQRGALTCDVDGGLWTVPPGSALWIPGGAQHAIKVTGALQGYGAFVAAYPDLGLPVRCRAIAVRPLLRELLIRAAHLPLLYEEDGATTRMLAVLLDELVAAKIEDLHLPMPADPRLRRIVDLMITAPAQRRTLGNWAAQAGVSARTLDRAIRRDTGMSFGRWRQQLAVMLAVRWMAGGATIQQVASDLGYDSVPSFMTMFRKVMGTSPGLYMAERHARA